MSNLYAEAAAGSRAQSLLENEIYRDAINKVREGIHTAWAESPIRDTEGQTKLRLMLKCLDDIEANIVSVANTGKMAAKQIEQENAAKEMAKRALQGLAR